VGSSWGELKAERRNGGTAVDYYGEGDVRHLLCERRYGRTAVPFRRSAEVTMRQSPGPAATLVLVLLALPLGAYGLRGLAAPSENRVTILYDAFGKASRMTKDWGYSALVEHGGKRILFDTGNNPDIFARNVQAAGARLERLDFAVVSHRHLDHTAGLAYLLRVNPDVKIYVPKESFGVFGSALPSSFYRRQDSLPREMRYYDGHPDDTLTFGTVWPNGRFVPVDSTLEVAPGVHVIALVSETPGTRELRELSLAIETADGMVVVAGCSHPGIERIVQAASAIGGRVYSVFGGFHLPAAPDAEIERIATALHDTHRVERVAPGHCTGEPAFHQLRKRWRDKYVYAGLGSVIAVPSVRR
jgi:7,8-dihydropterin-6-yl-methyl-4-(beta-D-ribofuranosyl)aminobenzene 5'-phosphate synthase